MIPRRFPLTMAAALVYGLCASGVQAAPTGPAPARSPTSAELASPPRAADLEDPQSAPRAPDPLHDISITLDVPRKPLFEAAAEVALGSQWSAQGELLLGEMNFNGYPLEAYLLGLQGRYFVLGSFEHGLDLAVAAEYVGVAAYALDAFDEFTRDSSTGLLVSALVGYKFIARFGLTVDVQVGLTVAALRTQSLVSAEAYNQVRPGVGHFGGHLRLGWSF